MSAIKQLDDALQERNKQTNAFLEEIIDIINKSVESLPFCTRANSTPEVADSVKVLKRDLDGIIAKIRNDENIDEHAAEGVVSRLKLSNLRKLPAGTSDRSSTSSYQSATGSPRSSGLIPSFSVDRPPSANRSSETTRTYPIVEPNANGEYDFYKPPRGGNRTRRR